MLRPHNCWALRIDGHEAAARCLAAELPWLPANHPMLLHRQQRVKAMSATLLLLAVKCCTLDLQWDLAPMVISLSTVPPPLLVNKLLVHPLAASMAMHPMAQPLATGHRDEVQVTAMALLLTMSPSPMAISFSFSLFKACMSQLGIKAELGMQMDEYTTVT
ncbi:hypothetical protein B296_00036012 [Ensete ventricosum]|uniref:Uncharacterized protein n=1 Tax=Ensete ventricosum TaxID=4639 RepID=A0A426YF85_ENSVE|nr:hypothetical protein B296_00036012 [Ensete ventricosum]